MCFLRSSSVVTSILMMKSGQARSHAMHAVHLWFPSSSYFSATAQRARSGSSIFSRGYCTVIGPRTALRIVMRMPFRMPVPHTFTGHPRRSAGTA